MDDDLTKTLWLTLESDATVTLRHPSLNPPLSWSRGAESFYGLLSKYGNTWSEYDGKNGQLVRLRVDYNVQDNKLQPEYDIWSLQHPRALKHLLYCGWTMAEFTCGDEIEASFSGSISTDDPEMQQMLKDRFNPDEVSVQLVSNLRDADPTALVVSSLKDGVAPARQMLSARTTCRVVIWTRAKPDAACANLIEIYPANPGDPPLPERWVDRLVKHLKNGQPPEAALRHIVWEDQKKSDRLPPGSLRLRNGTSKWSSLTYASLYYRDNIVPIVKKATRAPLHGRVQVIVTTAFNSSMAARAAASLRRWLDQEEEIELQDFGNEHDARGAAWVEACKLRLVDVAGDHAAWYEAPDAPRPLWLLQKVPRLDDAAETLGQYIVAVCQITTLRTPVYLHLVVVDGDGATAARLQQIGTNPPVNGHLAVIPTTPR